MTRRKGSEWIGGTASLPGYVNEGGEPYRPDVLLWMDADGIILGMTVVKPGEAPSQSCDSLREAMQRPMAGAARMPMRLRVASPELAEALRPGFPKIEIVCAPTPELDEVLAHMREHFAQDADDPQSYLGTGVTSKAVAAFFQAAAALFRERPWERIPDDQCLFAVTMPAFGLSDAALSVIGQAGESFGLVLFASLDDFYEFVAAAEEVELGLQPELPAHVSLNFERGADLPAELRKEIKAHGWEVAGPAAYPWPVIVDGDLVARPPAARELTMLEAMARAFTELLAADQDLDELWSGGEPLERCLTVATQQGNVEVLLRAPFGESLDVPADPSEDPLFELSLLSPEDDEEDPQLRESLQQALMEQFASSPESRKLEGLYACDLVMDLSMTYFGQTVATLIADELRELVFEVIPRKVSAGPSEARSIIEQCRAFYRFLKRNYELEQADDCLRVLGGRAVRTLEAALSNADNFGMAKVMTMAGREAGFDMDTPEGLDTWARFVAETTAGSAAGKARKAKKKKKRKAARSARKKNRQQ